MDATVPQRLFLVDGSHYDRLRSVLATPLDLIAMSSVALDGGAPSQSIYYRDVRDAQEDDRHRSFFAWLSRSGFEVKGRRYDPRTKSPRERYGTNLVNIAVDGLTLARPGDTIAIVAADIKLAPLLHALRDVGITCVLVSTCNAPQTIAPSEELVSLATRFIDLEGFRDEVALDMNRHDG